MVAKGFDREESCSASGAMLINIVVLAKKTTDKLRPKIIAKRENR